MRSIFIADHLALDYAYAEFPYYLTVHALLDHQRAVLGNNRFGCDFMLVGGQDNVDTRNPIGQRQIAMQSQFGDGNDKIDILLPQQFCVFLILGLAVGEFQTLGNVRIAGLWSAVAGKTNDPDAQTINRLDDVGCSNVLSGTGFGAGIVIVIQVGNNRVPVGFGLRAGEVVDEFVRAVNIVPIARCIGIDMKGVQNFNHGFALGEQSFSAAM